MSCESKGPDPPQCHVSPRNSRPYQGTINHWFPLIKPYQGLISWGGPLDCHENAPSDLVTAPRRGFQEATEMRFLVAQWCMCGRLNVPFKSHDCYTTWKVDGG